MADGSIPSTGTDTFQSTMIVTPERRQVGLAMSSPITPDLSSIHQSPAYHAMIQAWSSPVLLACSGGVDSTAMLLLAAKAVSSGKLGPFLAVHVDHLTRAEIENERIFLARLCYGLDVPFVSAKVSSLTGPCARASEALLRHRRYNCFAALARKLSLRNVVTAHTQNDQVETILMRLLSGASPVAACGMQPATDIVTDTGAIRLLRPLLETSRADLVQVLSAAGIQAIDDESNADRTFRRNALRLDILPQLQNIYPGFEQALVRSVGLAARDARYVDSQAEAVVDSRSAVTMRGGEVVVDRAFVANEPAALVSRVLKAVLVQLLGETHEKRREITFERLESLRNAASGRTGAIIQMPGGIEVLVSRAELRFLTGNRPGNVQ